MLRVEELLGNMTTQVALVMAPLLSWIHTGVANRGGKYAEGGSRGGGAEQGDLSLYKAENTHLLRKGKYH